MILPSDRYGRTSETVGYFAVPAATFARWLHEALGDEWRLTGPIATTLDDVAATLGRSRLVDRYVMIDLRGWTALLTNGPLGTDVGVLPSWVARRLDARGIRAVAAVADDERDRYGATILEVYDPEATDHVLRRRRTISAADDGGTWSFDQSGEPFDFEDRASYERHRIRDRFGPALLETYLEALGVPTDFDADDLVTFVVDRISMPSTPPPRT